MAPKKTQSRNDTKYMIPDKQKKFTHSFSNSVDTSYDSATNFFTYPELYPKYTKYGIRLESEALLLYKSAGTLAAS